MGLYDRFVALTKRKLDQYGMSASLVAIEGGGSVPCTILTTDYNPAERDGVLVQFTDRKIMMAAGGLAVVPDVELHRLQAGSELLRIITVKKFGPGGVTIFYELQVRR